MAGPVLLWSALAVGQALRPAGYDQVRDTISALAAEGAPHRWVMTAGLAGLGASYVVTAAGLWPARAAGRLVLAAGGVGTLLVAAFAQPMVGNSVRHTAAASVAFVSLAVWPVLGSPGDPATPLLSRPVGAAASLALLALVLWFLVEVHGGQRGLAERAAAGAEALWPLAVLVTTRRSLDAAGDAGAREPLPAPGGRPVLRRPEATGHRQLFFGSSENGVARSPLGSLGNPSTRSPMMLRWI